MKRIWMMALAALLAAAPAPAEAAEKIDNPEYGMWKDFKAGTQIKFQTVTQAGTTKTKMETTTKLKSKDRDKLVLTTTVVTFVAIPGQGEKQIAAPAQDRTVPAKIQKPQIPKDMPGTPKPEVKEGEETLKLLGKSFKCKWVETTVKVGETTIVSKTWTSTQVPGTVVKMTSSSKGAMPLTTEMVLIELKIP